MSKRDNNSEKRPIKKWDLKEISQQFQEFKLEQTVLERDFQGVERSARAIFENLLEVGTIINMGGYFDYNRKIIGYPELKKDFDDFTYPVNAIIVVEINKAIFHVELKSRSNSFSDSINVRIYCNPLHLTIAETILNVCSEGTVILEKKVKDLKALGLFFVYLQKSGDYNEIRTYKRGEVPHLILDSQYGLIPQNLVLVIKEDQKINKYHFTSRFNDYLIEIETDLDNISRIQTLLNEFFPVIHPSETKSQVKLVEPFTFENFGWDQLGGLINIKQTLQELIEYPIKNPALYNQLNLSLPKGILLVGPPGTGKTTVAKILASSTGSLLYYISPKDINSMWYGKSEQNIALLFAQVKDSIQYKDQYVIIFFDELDGFYSDRSQMHEATRRTFGQLCTELDGLEKRTNIIVLGATNRYEDLDPALTRPGRFDYKILFKLPDQIAREEIFKIHLSNKPISSDINFPELARLTTDFSGAEIAEICQKATFITLRDFSNKKGIPIAEIKGPLIDQIYINMDSLILAIKKEMDGK